MSETTFLLPRPRDPVKLISTRSFWESNWCCQSETPVTVVNIYSPPLDKQIQLHNTMRVDPRSWIIMTGDFNSHSPGWRYLQLDKKGEEVENWITENQLVLINTADDPDTFRSRTWRTTSTLDLAIAHRRHSTELLKERCLHNLFDLSRAGL